MPKKPKDSPELCSKILATFKFVAGLNYGSEFMMITVGHCRNVVAAAKYHAELGMTSRPKTSQKEYEEFMMAKYVVYH